MKYFANPGAFAVLLFLSFIAAAPYASAAQDVSFRLNWLVAGEGDLAPFFVAQDKGYYKQQGLNVDIQKGSGSGAAATLVGAGRVDIGISDFPTIALAIANGADLRIIASYQVNSPNSVWTRTDTGIQSPKDLPGHTIGSPAGDAQRIAWPAFAQAVGIAADSVKWVNISPAAKISSLAAKRVDATVHFMDQRCLYQGAVGEKQLKFFRWADYGVNPYGLMIFTTPSYMNQHPDAVRGFLEASFHGLRDAILDPRDAIQIAQKYRPEIDVNRVLSMLLISIKYMMYPGSDHTHPLGYTDPSRMQSSTDLMNKYFDVKTKLVAASLFTNKFVPNWMWPAKSDFANASNYPYPVGVKSPCGG